MKTFLLEEKITKKGGQNHLVSIITPTFNSEKTIHEVYRSLCLQKYTNWEWIVIDDNSTDETLFIIQKLKSNDSRIIFEFSKTTNGPAVARNIGISKARGRYIAFLDSDDFWMKDKLSRHISFMQKNDLAFSYTNYQLIDEDSNLIRPAMAFVKSVTYKVLLLTNSICCSTAIYDKNKLGKVYMPNLIKRQDYGLWLEILKKIPFAVGLNEVLTSYRLSSSSISSKKIPLIKYNWELFYRHEKLSVSASAFYLTANIFFRIVKGIKLKFLKYIKIMFG
jgi:teichuronic acid biosynthesis glycosyltransferase TuaG